MASERTPQAFAIGASPLPFEFGQVALKDFLGAFEDRQKFLRSLCITAFGFMPFDHLPLANDQLAPFFDMASGEGKAMLYGGHYHVRSG
jgi:hypothetical protein